MVSLSLNVGGVYDSIRCACDNFVVFLIVFVTMFGLFLLMLISMIIELWSDNRLLVLH